MLKGRKERMLSWLLILLPLSGFTQLDSIRSIIDNGEYGVFTPYKYIPTANSIFHDEDTHRMERASLNSIILNKEKRHRENMSALTECKDKNIVHEQWNSDQIMVATRCDIEVQKQRRLVKLWKHLTGVVGLVAFGGFIYIASK